MVFQLSSPSATEIIYPESDGKPMADNTIQFRWIMVIYHNLSWLFADDSMVFIAGDLLWYPTEGQNKVCQAPDVMVVFGVPKGDRGSYKQWEEGDVAPQVVFEILSPNNTQTEMNKKQVFYDTHGVEEYYLYDPYKHDLSGWLRSESRLTVIEEMNNWVSPRLGISFKTSGEELELYLPDGKPFASYVEIKKDLEQTQQRLDEQQKENARLKELLKAAGIDPEQNNREADS